MTDLKMLFEQLADLPSPPKEPPYLEAIRDALMIAIPPTAFGLLSATDRFLGESLLRLNALPWRGGRPGC